MPRFQVAIEGDVQGLLLDAYRRIDEGEQARKAANVVDNEVCYACPLANECGPTIKNKYLKKDVCLWREMAAVLDEELATACATLASSTAPARPRRRPTGRLPGLGIVDAGAVRRRIAASELERLPHRVLSARGR